MKAKQRICIIGLGQFGGRLANKLAEAGHEIIAIDSLQQKVNEIANQVTQAVVVDVRNRSALEAVVPSSVDLAIIALGENLEASILSTLHLKQMGLPKIIVKASSEDHASILRAIGASQVIFPERDSADHLASRLINPNLVDYIPLAEDYIISEVATPSSFEGSSIRELEIRKKYNIFVIAIKQMIPDDFILMPDPDFRLKSSDVLIVLGAEEDITRLGKLK